MIATHITSVITGLLISASGGAVIATDSPLPNKAEVIMLAIGTDGMERRQDRREDRQDRHEGRQDCRQEEGLVGHDKRDCKQEGRQDNRKERREDRW